MIFPYFLIIGCVLHPIWKITSATLIVAKCSDGIVFGSDGYTTSKGGLIGQRTTKKIFMLTPNTVVCYVSGGTDFYGLYEKLNTFSQKYHYLIEEGHSQNDQSILSTESLAKIARKEINTSFPKAHVVIAGIRSETEVGNNEKDKKSYCIFEILPLGSKIEQDLVIAGSSSEVLIAFLEEQWNGKPNANLNKVSSMTYSNNQKTVHQTVEMIQHALAKAAKIDHQSGGRNEILIYSKQK